MAENRVEVENPNEPRLTLHLHGPALERVDEKLVADCFTQLLNCAGENACFEKGLTVKCLGVIAQHDREAGCCSSAFGIAAR